ncbi:cell division cycle 5-related protein-like [Schistocerca gregaria]|uniref:cell division cycle 5-related protein-like n=1 Tax=Schistocerca gregaria TaxID=7010 RepID=UPI00211EE697|nr:cell division cycle 5-related protein-like [Schistocerca gregaria]
MRVHIKGGVWKNSEDEILKAAVMKYGLYQWGRIASLMNRKSAKQCKARWYEWLDPSIKKTEWSREEDEKLLHAAKIMPCQWRSVATMVGRTASQCLARYEKLLDAATQQVPIENDPRNLRPGEIDPNPENRPALPDAVDMEEDEKEMIQEARARMANTKGKKAKRKAREKQLEEARRLAVLQRKREMKAAGIDITQHRKKLKGPNYNREIPFYHAPAPGFYDVSEEMMKPPPPSSLKEMTMVAREASRKAEQEEKQKKISLLMEKERKSKDPLSALEELNRAAEAKRASIIRNSTLNLPPSQITEEELNALAKLVYDPDLDEADDALHQKGDQESVNPTKGLLSSYTGLLSTSDASRSTGSKLAGSVAQTPAMPTSDHILIEATNQAAMRSLQTPLLGGQNPVLLDSQFQLGKWKDSISTPNPIKTPLLHSSTPSYIAETPIRDRLGLNTPLNHASESDMISHKKLMKTTLRQRLSSLPVPKYTEFSIEIHEDTPVVPMDSESPPRPVDLYDIQKEQQRLQEEARRRIYQSCSSALKRGLPRPSVIPPSLSQIEFTAPPEDDLIRLAEHLIKQETLKILTHDLLHFPLPSTPPNSIRMSSPLEPADPAQLEKADELLQAEIRSVSLPDSVDWEGYLKRLIYTPSLRSYAYHQRASHSMKLESAQHEYRALQCAIHSVQKIVHGSEKKLSLYHGGYLKRCQLIEQEISSLARSLLDSHVKLGCFQQQQRLESLSIPQRIQRAKQSLLSAKAREKDLQALYQQLSDEKKQCQRLLS